MADIFFSYAHDDRPLAKDFVTELRALGHDVFWDRTKPPVADEPFPHVLRAEQDNARCVIVLWTKTSVARPWVEAEAVRALAKKKLIQVALGVDEHDLPQPFGVYMFVQLDRSPTLAAHPNFDDLLRAIAYFCPQPRDEAPLPPEPDAPVATQASKPGEPDAYPGWRPLAAASLAGEPRAGSSAVRPKGIRPSLGLSSKDERPDAVAPTLMLPHLLLDQDRENLQRLIESARRHKDDFAIRQFELLLSRRARPAGRTSSTQQLPSADIMLKLPKTPRRSGAVLGVGADTGAGERMTRLPPRKPGPDSGKT